MGGPLDHPSTLNASRRGLRHEVAVAPPCGYVAVPQLRDSVPNFEPTRELSGHERSRLLSPPIQSFQGLGGPFVAAPFLRRDSVPQLRSPVRLKIDGLAPLSSRGFMSFPTLVAPFLADSIRPRSACAGPMRSVRPARSMKDANCTTARHGRPPQTRSGFGFGYGRGASHYSMAVCSRMRPSSVERN
jgi:hypothetical protein